MKNNSQVPKVAKTPSQAPKRITSVTPEASKSGFNISNQVANSMQNTNNKPADQKSASMKNIKNAVGAKLVSKATGLPEEAARAALEQQDRKKEKQQQKRLARARKRKEAKGGGDLNKAEEAWAKAPFWLKYKIIIMLGGVGLFFIGNVLFVSLFISLLGGAGSGSSDSSGSSGTYISENTKDLTVVNEDGSTETINTEVYTERALQNIVNEDGTTETEMRVAVSNAGYNSDELKAMSVLIRSAALSDAESGSVSVSSTKYDIKLPESGISSNISNAVSSTKGIYLVSTSSGEKVSNILNETTIENIKTSLSSGKNYEEAIVEVVGDSKVVGKVIVTGTGLTKDEETGFLMRLDRPERDNKYYYEQNSNNYGRYLEGECAWYATCRAQEILASIGSDKKWSSNVNGKNYCYTKEARSGNFTVVKDPSKPKQGAIVSWTRGPYGHVAIIESVNEKEGTAVISEAWYGLGATSKLMPKNDANRKKTCESKGSGCFRSYTVQISRISKIYNGSFACYIYLMD